MQAADVAVTMGCGDACPLYPGKRYEDCELEDPAGRGVDALRPIRDEIGDRVRALLERDGRMIGPYDVLLAGHALSASLTVVTANTGEFSRVPDLVVENWELPPGS